MLVVILAFLTHGDQKGFVGKVRIRKWSYSEVMANGDREAVRRLILEHGVNAASYQIVNPVIEAWLSEDRQALVGYVPTSHGDVLAAGPICAPAKEAAAMNEFLELRNRDAVVFAAYRSDVPGLKGKGVVVGRQPCWELSRWSETVQGSASLRQQFNRARNKGVRIEEWSTVRAEGSPQLQRVLDAWLEARGLPPLHFLVEPQTLANLRDRRTFVAHLHGEPVAFLNLCPVPVRRGWLTEQFPRLPTAPNGTVESLMHVAAQTLAGEGYDYLTMGMVPLTPTASDDLNSTPLTRFAFRWMRAHGRRFYNFDGLYRFKSKFAPHYWEDLYLVPREGNVKLRHLLACATAFTGESMGKAIPRAVVRSAIQEIRWLTRRERGSR